MDTCSVRGDTVSQTNVLSFARICVVFCPNKCHVSARIGGSTAPPDPPSRTPMYKSDVIGKLSNLTLFMVSSAEYAASEFTKYIVQ